MFKTRITPASEEETASIGFNPSQDQEDALDLKDPINEGPKADAPKSQEKEGFDLDLDTIMPFLTGFLGSLGGKKEEAKTEYNTDNSSNECTRNVSFNFNFGDVRFHTK